MISERDALFLSQGSLEALNPETIADVDFDLSNEKAMKSIMKVHQRYEELIAPKTKFENKYDLTDKQLIMARKIKKSNPRRDFGEICLEVRSKPEHSIESLLKTQYLADLDFISGDQELAEDFYEKYQKDDLGAGVSKVDIDRLLKSDTVAALRKYSTEGKAEDENATDDKSESLESLISGVDSRPGISEFVNRSTGQTVEVDNVKMATDKKYFTQTVAELAKTQIANVLHDQNAKRTEQNEIINGLTKSREFRKFYYFTRKFFYKKFEEDLAAGDIKVDDQGNIKYHEKEIVVEPVEEEDDDRDNMNYSPGPEMFKYNKFQHIKKVFEAPKFDISDFKDYYPQEEYDALVKDFYEYTRGEDQNEKSKYIAQILLQKPSKGEVSSKISNNLRSLFHKLGVKVDKKSADASKIFTKIVTENFANMSENFQKEKTERELIFEKRYRDELVQEWNEYKERKLAEFLQNNPDQVEIDSSGLIDTKVSDNLPKISLEHLKPSEYEAALKEVSEISSLIGEADTKSESLVDVSSDHLIFEFFDNITNLKDYEYTAYEDRIHKAIYGDDKFDRGYKDPLDMSRNFKDIYDNEDPQTLGGIIRDHSLSKKLKGKKNKDQEKVTKEKGEFFTPPPEEHDISDIGFGEIYDMKVNSEAMLDDVPKLDEADAKAFEVVEHEDRVQTIEQWIDDEPTIFEEYQKFILPGRSENETDAYNIEEKLYEKTVNELRYQLERSVKNQKADSINIAMALLKKIQNTKMSHSRTLDAANIDVDEVVGQDTDEVLVEELSKLKIALDDQSSPSMSYIKDLHSKGLLGLDNDKISSFIDTTKGTQFTETRENLENIYQELENKEKVMVALQQVYDRKIGLLSKQDPNLDIISKKDEKVTEMLEKEIFDAYVEYQRDLLKKNDAGEQGQSFSVASDEHKINVIRSIFGVMETRKIANFGTDLLEFGISQDVPDAVRIGENIAGLENENVPQGVLDRLKDYKLANSAKLRERIEFTGPMKSIIEARKDSLATAEDRNGYMPSNYSELYHKYNDKYNRWRLPSIYAADHSKRGMIDEILGKEKLDKIEEYFR